MDIERSLSPSEVQQLRHRIHRAVDDAFDEIVAARERSEVGEVRFGPPEQEWDFLWPDGNRERFDVVKPFAIQIEGRQVEGRIAHTQREAWGRRDRGRWVVFGRSGSTDYPWLEWVETDDGRVAAPVPDPVSPRKVATDPDLVPEFAQGLPLARADELFERIRRGPSLRFALPDDAFDRMVIVAANVAVLRGRLATPNERKEGPAPTRVPRKVPVPTSVETPVPVGAGRAGKERPGRDPSGRF
jgi:hypothetical protein